MFDSTRQSIGRGLRRKFADIVCAEHAEAPKFKISGVYDNSIEEMDIQYHVDTCCQRFLHARDADLESARLSIRQ